MTRFIFITGGVVSSLGKGIASAALGALLQEQGYRVRLRKLDPYLNIDPGTMSPTQHGEVFVTDDGAETDLDLGHYERFTGVPALRSDNVTSGKIYSEVIARERRGDFGGQTVQVIPHVTDAIKEFIIAELEGIDFALIEIGGTVGDIESLPFLESIRQMGNELGRERCVFVHLTLVPYIRSAGEVKTKPTQHSVKELQSVGIQPDILLCRCDRPISSEALRKIALFCNLRPDSVVAAMDVDTIYQVPISYHESGFDRAVLQHFGLDKGLNPELARWRDIVARSRYPEGEVTVAVVGKYTNLADSYKSLVEALNHGGIANRFRVNLDWVEAEQLESAGEATTELLVERLGHVDAILVPGGFGQRGSVGKIRAVQFAREKNIPFLGICFGMQLAMIEASRHLAAMPQASSSEFGATTEPVVGLLTEWLRGNQLERRGAAENLGGTMRLGSYPCVLKPGSLVAAIYDNLPEIAERHRHRYEVNRNYIPQWEQVGFVFSGMSPDGALPEIVELPLHPWFVGVQFHPELKSRPFAPHPLFVSFIQAAITRSRLV
ncbi:MAG: CTP synthase [Alphaproteobacteria bacterium]|nr:CTP synthase [Alphaproteobacteria bacterium]